ncbi:hypothetical protein WN944_003745 [Citrus x changshan-huyou]|uniref:Uncharacterized protein n=1 Tax=Citrus x changshan-huyou TaxID=2935761 RepID=A0AAP0QIA3_9ROSI
MYIYLYKLKESLVQEWGFELPEEIITNNATIKCTDFLPLTTSGKVEGEKVLGKIETPFEKMKVAAYTLSAISPCMGLFEVIAKEIQALLNPDDASMKGTLIPLMKHIQGLTNHIDQSILVFAVFGLKFLEKASFANGIL